MSREETRCRHMGYSFRLAARFFYMHHPADRITHTTAFVTPVVEHWLEREIARLPNVCLMCMWRGTIVTFVLACGTSVQLLC